MQLEGKLSPGYVVIQETVVNDGSSRKVEAEGTTVEEAVQEAKALLPPQATIEKQDVVQQPTRETIRVAGFEESEAREKAAVAKPKRIESVSMTESGRKGFLGIGRCPHMYDILITQPALVRITYRELASIRSLVGTLLDKYCRLLSSLSDAECAAIIHGKSEEEAAAVLEALKGYSGEVQLQTLLAGIDHLATGPESSRQLAMQFLVAKESMPSTAWKIAYEFRERALQEDEIIMHLSQSVDEFRKTPAWGKGRAQSALDFVRKFFEQFPQGRDQFEERYTYFSRSGSLVTDSGWYVLPREGRKRGPLTLMELPLISPEVGMRIRREGDPKWVAVENARYTYPDLMGMGAALLERRLDWSRGLSKVVARHP